MLSCREFLQVMLDGWRARSLPPRRLRACDEHVAGCAACARYVRSFAATVDLLHDMRADASGGDVPEDLVQDILGARR